MAWDPDGELAVGGVKVMAQNDGATPVTKHSVGQGGEVLHHVVGGDVVGRHGGVVRRATPVFTTANLRAPFPIGLCDGERHGGEDVALRAVGQAVKVGVKGEGTVRPGQQRGARRGPTTRPKRASSRTSESMTSVCGPGWARRSWRPMYSKLALRKSSTVAGWA